MAEQVTSQKLEENPLLPLDNQANLVYTLTRIFRLLAQIVNPLVAWAAKWAGIEPGGSSWGNILYIKATPPTTGNGAALVLQAEVPDGAAVVAGERPAGTRMWNIRMPTPDVAGDFQIERLPTTAAAYAALRINRANGDATFEGVAWGRGWVSTAPAANIDANISMLKGGSGQANQIIGRTGTSGSAASLRWLMRMGGYDPETGGNAGSNFDLSCNSDTGAGLYTVMQVIRSTGKVYFPAPGGVDITGRLTVASGMNLHWDGGGFNYLCMGAGTESAWNWQWNRGNGVLSWLGSSSQQLMQIDPSGNCTTAAGFRSNNQTGIIVNGTASDGGTGIYQDAIQGNPQWNWTALRCWHQTGLWAGFLMQSTTQSIQFRLSGGSGMGEIQAGAFTQVSDERMKSEVAPLERQHDAFMGIVPIKWHWPTPPKPKRGEAPIYADLREQWGFSAQNLSQSVALAVSGDVDATDAKGKPVPAAVNHTPITALTVLEVQALWQRLTALEAQVQELKAA